MIFYLLTMYRMSSNRWSFDVRGFTTAKESQTNENFANVVQEIT